MTPDDVRRLLADAGYQVKCEGRLGNDTGIRMDLATGQIVNVYDSGKHNVQGKNPEPIRRILEGAPSVEGTSAKNRQVFVVYGHDRAARTELADMLRRWKLEPLILEELPSEGMTIIEKLEHYRGAVEFAIVLATPDDEGHRAGSTSEKAFRARQNVVLELGMMLSFLGRRHVAILIKDQEKMERPSDIQGLIYAPFKDHVDETRIQLAKELNAAGIRIDVERL